MAECPTNELALAADRGACDSGVRAAGYDGDAVVAWALLALAGVMVVLSPRRCWVAWTRREP